MSKIWRIKKHDYETVKALAETLEVKPIIAALLISRGFGDAERARRYLAPCLDDLHDPAGLKGIAAAAERILRAIDANEKILVWGDYDVDGTTGTVLLRRAIKHLGGTSEYHIPNRFTEGYGLNISGLDAAARRGCRLVVTVDCGIRSFDALAWAADNGLDVIVTDHHLSDAVRGNPPAAAIVNPNQTGCEYPDKDLAGVGVAFKLAQVLLRERAGDEALRPLLKIAAIGTVADVMRLTGENRAIVALGLADLGATNELGIRALIECAGCTQEMTSYDIGFRIGPRINAAGRMDIARHVVELLECEDADEARRLAQVLDSRNRERQGVQERITSMAVEQAASADNSFLVLSGDGWHRGVIGLAASRIAERLRRPTIVLSVDGELAHGSARSVGDFHLINALDTCADLFEQFGGHAAAAGMTIRRERISALRERLDGYASQNLTPEHLEPVIEIDALVRSESLNLGLFDDLKALEPCGAGNPRPILNTRGLIIRGEPRILKEKHLKFNLTDADGRGFEAVWWGGVEASLGQTFERGDRIEAAYTLEENRWQGTRSLQLVIADLRKDNTTGAEN